MLHMLNRLFQHTLGSQWIHNPETGKESHVVELLPELTNADLEVLFTQLLEGVYQARGQQWALKYLQRMENRITVERWLDWLLIFGERLLASPAPNHQLATRMVQLGELDVGKVGELAYDIGIKLLERNFDSDQNDQEEVPAETIDLIDPLLDTPGQRLLRQWGEQLWEHGEEIIPAPTLQDKSSSGDYAYQWVQHSEINYEHYEPTEVDNLDIQEVAGVNAAVNPEKVVEIVEEDLASNSMEPAREELPQDVTPTLPYSLNELVVRLEQSTHLVEKLATELASRESQIVSQRESVGVPHERLALSQPSPSELPSQLTLAHQSQTYFYHGLQLARAGDLAGALEFYDRAIKLQPQAHQYWFNKALTFCYLQNFEEALAAYDQAINLKPDFFKAWYNRGAVLGELGDCEAAIASFDTAIDIKPDYAEAWSAKGLALLKLGLIAEAIASYDNALHLSPEDPETWYYRGVALGITEQYPEAIAAYDQALAIQPDYYEVWIDRGVVLFNLNQWSEAIDSWDRALSSQPELYLAWYNRGVALDNLYRREEAIFSYQQAIAIKSDFHLAWYNQAVALFHLQRFAESITCYDSALKIKPDYWEAWLGRGVSAGSLLDYNHNTFGLISTTDTSNSDLYRTGYVGKLASYEEGLKHLRLDTHPEGWGRLHFAIANALYEQGKKESRQHDFWYKAVYEYQQSLIALTAEEFPELHLEVLQSFIKVLVGLREIIAAKEVQQISSELLQKLLDQPHRPEESKKQLLLKFAGLNQLAVDLAVSVGDLVEAWEIAEQSRNAYLHWLLADGSDRANNYFNHDTSKTSYTSVQQLIDPSTAIVYWQISPAAIQTFIIKDRAPSPILIFTPIQDVEVIPEAVRNLIELENWLENWQNQYQDFCHQTPDSTVERNHPWRIYMEQNLLQLQEILNIPTIIPELEGISCLILVPHRDLSRLPLHALFHLPHPSIDKELYSQLNYTITYLPTIQIAIAQTTELRSNWQNQKIAIVENSPINEGELSPREFSTAVIKDIFDSAYQIKGIQATKAQVSNYLARDCQILHFAAQAINNFNEPLKSGLLLSETEQLTLGEICQQAVSAYNLVTLADCEIVRNTHQNTTSEYIGLDAAWLIAGIPHIIMPLWHVPPTINAVFMIEFYSRLKMHHAGQSPAMILAETTAWLRDLTARELTQWYENLLRHLHPEAEKIKQYLITQMEQSSQISPDQRPYHHPYYWSAYIIVGKFW